MKKVLTATVALVALVASQAVAASGGVQAGDRVGPAKATSQKLADEGMGILYIVAAAAGVGVIIYEANRHDHPSSP